MSELSKRAKVLCTEVLEKAKSKATPYSIYDLLAQLAEEVEKCEETFRKLLQSIYLLKNNSAADTLDDVENIIIQTLKDINNG